MNAVEIMSLVIIVVLVAGWRISWLATRVDRANARAERTWAALDAALVRRAQRALELVLMPDLDPATALLVADAAAAALEPNLSRPDRERAESDLSHVLDTVGPMLPAPTSRLDSERARASICRRLHNDAVATALSLRRRHIVRILSLAGHAAEPRTFEMADGSICTLTAGPQDSLPSSLAYVRPAVYAAEPRGLAVGEAGQPVIVRAAENYAGPVTGSERQASIAGAPQSPGTPPVATTAGLTATPALVAQGVPLYDTDRVWTLPNALSLLRLAGAPVVLWLIVGPQADGLAVLVLALGGLTDWLDGYLARAWHQTSRVGQMLDPIADRLYILAVLIGLAMREIIPWWLVALVVGRDVMIASLIPVLKTRGFSSLPVHFLGKTATFSLLYAFPLVLLGSGETGWLELAWVLGWAFAIWGTALYWYAGGLYVAQTINLVRAMPPIDRRQRRGVTG